MSKGNLNPITQIARQIVSIFQDMGFELVEGPLMVKEWYNFEALNMPEYHPARDMQDTFYTKDSDKLLRTQTSTVQIEYMENHKPPFKIVSPGRVFRRDASDASHLPQFYQMEGLAVDENISLADLKSILEIFIKRFLGDNTSIRFRPGYFPYVEPGMEVDIGCTICQAKGCPTCKNKGWVEVLGAGMVHPAVFKAVKYDPDKWQGFAFGLGLDRFAMLKYQIDDIRLFYSGDLRFLKQF